VALELFNTLSGKIEPLFASDGRALRFYCCGPTVYDYGHIGNCAAPPVSMASACITS
jgi:cysteinyl-tRNA synthetase